jgi:hydrogenase-4 component E
MDLTVHSPLHASSLVDVALVAIVLLDLVLLGATRMTSCIRTVAFQGAILAAVPPLIEMNDLSVRVVFLAVMAFVVKAMVIPSFLFRALRNLRIHREVEPFIGFLTSLALGALAVAASFLFSSGLPLPGSVRGGMLVPTALSTALIGAIVLVSRRKAITQVVGYLVIENGVFLLGLLLHKTMPGIVEAGALLDVFVGVFVMGIVIFQISREFASIDTQNLSALKEE